MPEIDIFVPADPSAFKQAAKQARWKVREDGRYGAILWVAPKDVKKASALLGAS